VKNLGNVGNIAVPGVVTLYTVLLSIVCYSGLFRWGVE